MMKAIEKSRSLVWLLNSNSLDGITFKFNKQNVGIGLRVTVSKLKLS